MTLGGPLQVSNDEQVNCTYTQIGIVSYGPKLCEVIGGAGKFFFCRFSVLINIIFSFSVSYVNVYKYLDWIEGIVWKDEA